MDGGEASPQDWTLSRTSLRIKNRSRAELRRIFKATPFAAGPHSKNDGCGVVAVLRWLGWLAVLLSVMNPGILERSHRPKNHTLFNPHCSVFAFV